VSIETDTTHRTCSPRAVLLADGVHDLAQKFLVGDLVHRTAGKRAREAGLELVDLGGRDLLKCGTIASPDSSWAESDEQRVRAPPTRVRL